MSDGLMRRRKSPSSIRPGAKNGAAKEQDAPRITFQQRRLRSILFAVFLVCAVLVLFPHQRNTTVIYWDDFCQDYQRRYHRNPPESLKQWLHFAASRNCETNKFYDGIERDLAIFRNRKLDYDRLIQQATEYSEYNVVITMHNNKLTFSHWKRPDSFHMTLWKKIEAHHLQDSLRWLLKPVVQHKPPIYTRFVLNLHDEPPSVVQSRDKIPNNINATYPIFSSCQVSHATDNVTYDSKATDNDEKQQNTFREIVMPYYFGISTIARGLWFWPFYSKGPPWNQRKDAITWRGSTTGKWEASPRFWLVENYSNVHDLAGVDVDFAFVRVVQNYDGQELPDKYRRADSMSYRDVQKHKYVIDVDGNAFTERFPKLLRSGSTVFKSTMYGEWFSERVQPFVDYIPVNYDLSDLEKKVEWAHTHPSLAETIAEHGKESVERHIRPEDQQCYTYRLLLEYHSLFES